MQLTHDRKDLEHVPGGVGILSPATTVERLLRHLLAGAEAVVDRATLEARAAQLRVDSAAVVGLQVSARLTGVLVHRKIRGLRERKRHTAQPEAVGAISEQIRHRSTLPAAGIEVNRVSKPGASTSSPELLSGTEQPVDHEGALITDLAAITSALRAAGCVYAEDEAALLIAAFAGKGLELALARRISGTPLEQVLGWAEFFGMRIIVEPGVFVPRKRTELLVNLVVPLDPGVVLDICCGSGAVGAALAQSTSGLQLHASDIDPAAARCALRNVEPFGGHVYAGDLYSPLPGQLRGTIDVIVANAPYVPSDAIGSMPTEARDFEPRVALDGGTDGLDLHRRIAAEAREWLVPTGHLLIETSERQAERTADILRNEGFETHVVHSDELDATAVIGRVATSSR